MASIGRFLTKKLRLKVNEAKSAVARPEERKFLGFSISNDGSERRIAPKALDKFKTLIRDMTRRTGDQSAAVDQGAEAIPHRMARLLRFCQTPRVLTNLEAWIRRRLRMYLWRQCGNGHNRFKELRHRGVPKFSAAAAAGSPTGFWRMSGHRRSNRPCATITSSLSASLGSMSLPKLNPIEPPWYGPVCPVVWEGGVARRPPIPNLQSLKWRHALNQ
ncbi:RNA-directed DNA polymerase (Reverse transcriptase) [Mesorhizobium ventifaucium]|uniref:RNA-directed DNA polymerase (Reverse transcriptase) n=1 Tax=Mesorhizobium ventifaucium TaxID=666020 RepID=A0ABN8J939_9HYPH|nr:RNA-directed DNA polymerase (Reverse transcriptase) [Mesorhizobium ventifaucium]